MNTTRFLTLVALNSLVLLSPSCSKSTDSASNSAVKQPSSPAVTQPSNAKGLRIGGEYKANRESVGAPGGGAVFQGVVYKFGEKGVSVWKILSQGRYPGHIFRSKADGSLYAHTTGYMDLPSDIVLGPGERVPILENATYKVDGSSVYVDWSRNHSKYFPLSGCDSSSEVLNIKNEGLILESATAPGHTLTLDMFAK